MSNQTRRKSWSRMTVDEKLDALRDDVAQLTRSLALTDAAIQRLSDEVREATKKPASVG